MNAKEYLSQIFRMEELIRANKEELMRLNTALYLPAGVTYEEKVQSTGSVNNKMDLLLYKKDELEKKINAEINKLYELREDIRVKILSIDDELTQLVFRIRYLEGLTWEKVCVRLDITFQWAHVLHKRGLEELNDRFVF